jgi:hypothetical protein
MMNIAFNEDEDLLTAMQEEFNTIPDAFFKTHYELSSASHFDALSWKKFLTHPAVVDWLTSEMRLIQQATLRGLMKDLNSSSNAKSTGIPQLINALSSQVEKTTRDDGGPIFVYAYIPLNDQEEHATNVIRADRNAIKDIVAD